MARAALERQAEIANRLSQMRCSQVSLGGEDMLILDFGDLSQSPGGQLAGALILSIECPWRIDSESVGVIGWQDDEEDVADFATVLIDARVEETEVRRPGYDLILRFSNDHTLHVFPDCRAYFDDELAGGALPWQFAGEAAALS